MPAPYHVPKADRLAAVLDEELADSQPTRCADCGASMIEDECACLDEEAA